MSDRDGDGDGDGDSDRDTDREICRTKMLRSPRETHANILSVRDCLDIIHKANKKQHQKPQEQAVILSKERR